MNDSGINLAELVTHLQEIGLSEDELSQLIELITSEGLTDKVKRKVRLALVKSLERDEEELNRYEEALEVIQEYNKTVEEAVSQGEKELNRLDMQTKSKLDSLERRVSEDTSAAKAGATLLIHTEDISQPPVEKEFIEEQISPKQAAAMAVAGTKGSSPALNPITQPAEPISPSMPSLPKNEPLPATVAPLPSTPIAPPAVTQPTQ